MSPDDEEVMIKSKRICPRCSKNLHVVERKGDQLDICTECGGIWFDPSELDDIVGEQSPVELLILITDSLKGEGLSCPECRKRMVAKEVLDVYVDFCSDCKGIWMDRGETEKVWAQEEFIKHPYAHEDPLDSSRNFWSNFKEKYSDFE